MTTREVYARLAAEHGGPAVAVGGRPDRPAEWDVFPSGARVGGSMYVQPPPRELRPRLHAQRLYHATLAERLEREADELAAALTPPPGRGVAPWVYPKETDWLYAHVGPPDRAEPGPALLARLRALAARSRVEAERIDAELAADLARCGRPAAVA